MTEDMLFNGMTLEEVWDRAERNLENEWTDAWLANDDALAEHKADILDAMRKVRARGIIDTIRGRLRRGSAH
jgi:hypothetical protein